MVMYNIDHPQWFCFYHKKIGQDVVIVCILSGVKSCVPSSFVPLPEVISAEVSTKHDFVLCFVYIPPDSPSCLFPHLVCILKAKFPYTIICRRFQSS